MVSRFQRWTLSFALVSFAAAPSLAWSDGWYDNFNDGNAKDGDGCSKDGVVETGYACQDAGGTLPPTLVLPIVGLWWLRRTASPARR